MDIQWRVAPLVSIDILEKQTLRSTVSGLLRDRLYTIQFALRHALAAYDPGDKRILEKTLDDFSDIRRTLLSNEFAALEETRYKIFEHLHSTTNIAATIITAQVQQESAITIKLLWIGDDQTELVRTLLRNDRSREDREHVQPPNFFPYELNTAFKEVACNKAASRYFVSDNLTALEAEGKYRNAREKWPYVYNAAAVVGIPGQSLPAQGLVGFLCADALVGRMSSFRIRRTLEVLSAHIYSVFRLAFIIELAAVTSAHHVTTERELLLKLWSQHVSGVRAGWQFRDSKLRPIDTSQQLLFQTAIMKLEEAHHRRVKNANARAANSSPRLSRRSVSLSFSQQGEQGMLDTDLPISDSIPDAALDQERLRALQDKPVTDDEFLSILEELAPRNPYANDLLRAAKKAQS
jgi:hypothetical protein